MADAHGSVLLHEHERRGLADDIAGTHHHHVAAGHGNVFGLEQLLHTIGRARREHRAAGDEATDVVEMETVHVLVHGDAFQHRRNTDMRRQRQLDEDAVDGRVGIQGIDTVEYLLLAGAGGQLHERGLDTHVLASADLVAHIDARSGTVAHQNDREPGSTPPLGLQCVDAAGIPFAQRLRNSATIDDLGRHSSTQPCTNGANRYFTTAAYATTAVKTATVTE